MAQITSNLSPRTRTAVEIVGVMAITVLAYLIGVDTLRRVAAGTDLPVAEAVEGVTIMMMVTLAVGVLSLGFLGYTAVLDRLNNETQETDTDD